MAQKKTTTTTKSAKPKVEAVPESPQPVELEIQNIEYTVAEAVKLESEIAEAATEEVTAVPVYKVKKELDINSIIPVRNGFAGKLVYRSPRTDERFEWAGYGDELDIPLSELKSAKAGSKRVYFENNWFEIDDPDVIEYLGVERFYNNVLNAEKFEALLNQSPENIISSVQGLTKGQRASLTYRVRNMIANGIIDSVKTIEALEVGLNTHLS